MKFFLWALLLKCMCLNYIEPLGWNIVAITMFLMSIRW